MCTWTILSFGQTPLQNIKLNIALILGAQCKAELYCSLKRTSLFCMEVDFLGHHLSMHSIETDNCKVMHILNWPAPTTVKHIWQFMGLVRYISSFLPTLVEHTIILTPLTCKECNMDFLKWTAVHQYAFDAIKRLVVSHDCLTVINHKNPGDNKILATCDASKRQTGTILAFGPTWESARTVAFESHQLNSAEQNYPGHKQEMLAIMQALHKWHVDLLGAHIHI